MIRVVWPRVIGLCIAIPAVVFLVTFVLADWGTTTFGLIPWTIATAIGGALTGWAAVRVTKDWWLRRGAA